MCTWQARQILITESTLPLMPWDGQSLWCMLLTAKDLAEAEVLELHLAPNKDLCVTLHVCVRVYLCFVNYTHTPVAKEPLNLHELVYI